MYITRSLVRRLNIQRTAYPIQLKSNSLHWSSIRKSMPTPQAEPEMRLHEFSACEVSDALTKLGIRGGGFIPDIKMYSPSMDNVETSMCGPAYTVKMVPASDKTSPSLQEHFVDTAPEGSVIIITAPNYVKSAIWGGLMTAGAKAKGAIGVVLDGRCRDLAEHRARTFPVFARGQSTVGQGGHTRPSTINEKITIKPIPNPGDASSPAEEFPEVDVSPGDFIVADVDGVVCVPTDMVDAVVEKCKVGREIDAKCMADIEAGKGVQASFKLHRGK
ncbi:hypothetical protein FRC03_010414 [Tulasnella sp. 419]|nr:hypothetical protein FRC03_010414 [Tulasnella sp. 419]